MAQRPTKKGSTTGLNSGPTPSSEAEAPPTPTPSTPITPQHPSSFNAQKGPGPNPGQMPGAAAAAALVATNNNNNNNNNPQAPTSAPTQTPQLPQVPPPPPDLTQVAPFAAPDGTDVSLFVPSIFFKSSMLPALGSSNLQHSPFHPSTSNLSSLKESSSELSPFYPSKVPNPKTPALDPSPSNSDPLSTPPSSIPQFPILNLQKMSIPSSQFLYLNHRFCFFL